MKSVKTRPRYGDFSIFKDGGRRHLGFSKFQIWSKSVKWRPKYDDFSIFPDGGRRHLELINF